MMVQRTFRPGPEPGRRRFCGGAGPCGECHRLQRQILVNVEPLEVRAAVLEDGVLAELMIERPLSQRMAGNIYKGRVENILPGMEAAFVNIGYERNAFLYVGDAVARVPTAEAEEGEGDVGEGDAAGLED